jgi:hypothetical protein
MRFNHKSSNVASALYPKENALKTNMLILDGYTFKYRTHIWLITFWTMLHYWFKTSTINKAMPMTSLLIFRILLSTCNTALSQQILWKHWQSNLQCPITVNLTTFSPCNAGTDSRRLVKLSLMWSLRFLSNALWCARFSACKEVQVNLIHPDLKWDSEYYLDVHIMSDKYTRAHCSDQHSHFIL